MGGGEGWWARGERRGGEEEGREGKGEGEEKEKERKRKKRKLAAITNRGSGIGDR